MGAPTKPAKAVLLGGGGTVQCMMPAAFGGRNDTQLVPTICLLIAAYPPKGIGLTKTKLFIKEYVLKNYAS